MAVEIPGWTINDPDVAREIRAAIAELQNEEVANVDVAYVRTWMANKVRQVVMDRRRRIKAEENPIDETDPMEG